MRSRLKTLISVSIILLTLLLTAFPTAFAETITYTYDNLNRLTKMEYGSSTTITYTYDAAGNRLTMSSVTTATPTPSPTVTPTPTVVASPTPTQTVVPTPEPAIVITPTLAHTPTPIPLPTGSPTTITLLYFKAEVGNNGTVTLTWETATEIANAGFNLYRARHKKGAYTKINDTLIPAKGDALSGDSYSYMDTPGKGIFYYKLEDVDYNGMGGTMHGPEKVKVKVKERSKDNSSHY